VRGDHIQSRAHYYGLDAVRFVAALSVAVFHLGFWSWAGIWDTIDSASHIFGGVARFDSIVGITSFGWVGVEVFFVISGFVIANSASGASPISFLKARMIRLYPAVWICASCTLAVLLLLAADPIAILLAPYVKSMLLFPKGPWIDGVYWTLSVEISFYAIIFVVLFLGQFVFIHRVAWCLTVYSTSFVVFSLVQLAVKPPADILALKISATLLRISLLPHGCFFALGIWLWLAVNRRMTPYRWFGLAVAFIGGGAEVYTQTVLSLAFVPAMVGQLPWIPPTAWAIGTVCIFVSALGGDHLVPRSEFSRTILKYLGLMSYPIYLLHNVVGAAVARILIEVGINPLIAILLALVIIVLFSLLLCSTLEPALALQLRRSLNYLESRFLRPRRSIDFLFR
jgi:peptidoglycan/LPS O-acetylase OafA/YrhL